MAFGVRYMALPLVIAAFLLIYTLRASPKPQAPKSVPKPTGLPRKPKLAASLRRTTTPFEPAQPSNELASRPPGVHEPMVTAVTQLPELDIEDLREEPTDLAHPQRHVSRSFSAAGLASGMHSDAAATARHAPYPAPRAVDPKGPAEVPGWVRPDILPSGGVILGSGIKKSVRM